MITGSAGFIGSHLAENLLESGHEVLGIDNFLSSSYSREIKIKNIEKSMKYPNYTFLEIDLCSLEDSKVFQKDDIVINEAAMPGLPLSWVDPELYFRSNTFLPVNLLRLGETAKIKKFVQISTSSVYGKFAVGDESLPINPASPYGVSKLAAEQMVRNFCNIHDIEFNILRYFSVYGPRQRPDMAYSQIISKIIRDEQVFIYGDGKQSRTNTYVTDIVSGTIAAIDGAQNGEIYNLSGDISVSLLETVNFIASQLGKSGLRIEHLPERIGDQKETKGQFEKANKHFGYKPKVNFWDGLKEQIQYQLRFH